ncbi:hypothetical protein LBMAG42_29180 [Deltaproteobacteria bacterium]|nr:hypothetical protein LBMAG42_29180 [Deltaproteobacteria bacterium]
MSAVLTTAIAEFSAGDLCVRIPSGLFSVLPFAPAWTHPGSLLEQAGSARAAELAEEAAKREGATRALQVFGLLDKADAGIAIFSGLRGAVKAYRKEDGAWEVDPQQGVDAALKVLGIAWAAWSLYEGDAAKLASSKAGRAILAWYVAADLVLPFADNVAEGGVGLVTGVIDRYTPDAAAQLAAMGGPDAAASTTALAAILGTVKGLAAQGVQAAGPLNGWAKEKLPGVLGGADAISGAAATAADALSVYRYFGTALVAEVCVAEGVAKAAAEQAAKAEHDRAAAAAQAEALVREETSRREAEAKNREASAQREDYSLAAAEPASSLQNAPIKYTRQSDEKAGLPAKSGCFGCAGVMLAIFVLGAASTAWAALG